MESINNDGLQWNVVTSPLPDGSCGAACKYTVDVDMYRYSAAIIAVNGYTKHNLIKVMEGK